MNFIKKCVQSAYFACAIKASSVFKVSYIVGSHIAWFSASSIITPLSGAFGGVTGSSCVLLLRFLIHLMFVKALSLSFLAFYIPGYCASLYWATRSSLIRVVLPLACMALFIAHPIGSQAFLYSFYWLIPVLLFGISRNFLFLEALGSTFVAHAVGSVIFLYTVPTTAVHWVGLIPIVALERLFFAMGMVVVYHTIMAVKNFYTSFFGHLEQTESSVETGN